MPPSPSCSSARQKPRRGIANRHIAARGARGLYVAERRYGHCSGRLLVHRVSGHWTLAKQLHNWIASPSEVEVPAIRREFLTLAGAARVEKNPGWAPQLNGDLQMHTTWSDGGGTIADMATTAIERGYKFIGIADHTQLPSIAGGLDETRLAEKGREIVALNTELRQPRIDFTILRSAEMNLSPEGAGDMRPAALRKLDLGGRLIPFRAASEKGSNEPLPGRPATIRVFRSSVIHRRPSHLP